MLPGKNIYGLEAGQRSHQNLLTVANAGGRGHDKANTHVFLSRFGVKSHGMWSWDPGAHHNTDNKQGNEKIWFNLTVNCNLLYRKYEMLELG